MLGCNTTDNCNLRNNWIISTTSTTPTMMKDKTIEAPKDDRDDRADRGGKGLFAKKSRMDDPDNSNYGTTTTNVESMEHCYQLLQQHVHVHVPLPIDQIKIIDVIGFGRNGYNTRWI
jgi:hypothetical protein